MTANSLFNYFTQKDLNNNGPRAENVRRVQAHFGLFFNRQPLAELYPLMQFLRDPNWEC